MQEQVKAGEFDDLADYGDYGPAIAYIKGRKA